MVWRQTINTDTAPVLDSTHSIVYASKPCESEFANTEFATEKPHKYQISTNGEYHQCSVCNKTEQHADVATFTVDEANHSITATCPSGCDLGKIELSASNTTYDGTDKAASTKDTITGFTTPDIVYEKKADNGSFATINSTPKDAGTYRASITYTVDAEAGKVYTVSTEYTITQATPDIGKVSVQELNNTLDVLQVQLSRTDNKISGTLSLKEGTTLQYGTHDYTYVFTPDDEVNYKPVEGNISITVKDTIAPTAAYKIGENGWKEFVNTISFGLFCKDYKTVEIKYSDVNASGEPGSGVKTKQYYIADKELTEAEIAALQWKDYASAISLNPEGVYFIYVKVEDNAGNSVVLNSEGIVIYAESTLNPVSMDYTYKENKDLEVQIAMNGNTFGKLMDEAGTEIAAGSYTIDASGKLTDRKSVV